jgi:hypothetical protein
VSSFTCLLGLQEWLRLLLRAAVLSSPPPPPSPPILCSVFFSSRFFSLLTFLHLVSIFRSKLAIACYCVHLFSAWCSSCR